MMVFSDVAVVVGDAQRSAKWWKEKCGFDIRDNEGHWVTVAAPGDRTLIHLCQNRSHEEGNTGIGWWVDDVFATAEAWQKKGVEFTRPPSKSEWGTNAMFADPDGNEFWLKEKAPAKKKASAKTASAKNASAKKRRA